MLQLVSDKPRDESSLRQTQASQHRFRLARLLLSTEAILNHAMAGEWSEVEVLERDRQLELADCFASAPTDDSDEVIQALATLVQMNREITRLVAQAREDLVLEQQQAQVRQQVVQTYAEHYGAKRHDDF